MSVPATEGWFSLSIRRNRKSFILATVFLIGILIALAVSFWFFDARGNTRYLVASLFLVPAMVCTYFLTAQRLRDMNTTGWLALLWIPIGIADKYVGGAASLTFLIVLCAVPGSPGENRYGPNPIDHRPFE